MIPWDEKMFTTTKYLFDVSTTWQYMVLAAAGMFILWIVVSIVENFMNAKMTRMVEQYIYRPLLFIVSIVIIVGMLFYLIVVLKDYIWGVG